MTAAVIRGNHDDFLKPENFRKHEEAVNDTIGFIPFDNSQARKKAIELAFKFMKVANQNPNAIEKVIEEASNDFNKGTDPELIRWALMVFISYRPELALMLFICKNNLRPEVSAPGPSKPAASPAQHDTNFNEHPDDTPDPNRVQHGELFMCMHRQMLARLDTECLALGMPLTNPLENLRDPNYYDLKLGDMGTSTVDKMEQDRKFLEETIKNGISDGTEITPDGAAIESLKYHRPLHNNVMPEYIRDPSRVQEAGNDLDVLHSPRVDLKLPPPHSQDTLSPNDFSDAPPVNTRKGDPPNDFSDAPPVNIQKEDIILCPRIRTNRRGLAFKDKLPITHGDIDGNIRKGDIDEQLPITHGATQDKEATEFDEKTFGGNNFNTNPSSNETVTNELQTKMKHKKWTMVEDSGATVKMELFPREYYYNFRVENTSSSPLDVTFRVYLAPEELANSRHHWIEMDKFKQTLPSKSKTVVCRDCDMSSIPQKTEDELDYMVTQPGLPRGRKGGMNFKLLVLITDWSKEKVPTPNRCNNRGPEKVGGKYPDSRPMGYPFDKPFKNNSYEETFKGLKNATIKDVSIKWVDDFPEIAVKA